MEPEIPDRVGRGIAPDDALPTRELLRRGIERDADVVVGDARRALGQGVGGQAGRQARGTGQHGEDHQGSHLSRIIPVCYSPARATRWTQFRAVLQEER